MFWIAPEVIAAKKAAMLERERREALARISERKVLNSACKYCGSNHVEIGKRCKGCGAGMVE